MGIVNRLKNRVKGGIKLARTIAESAHEEARHPGRPPSSMAADSPVWKDNPNDAAHQKAAEGIAQARKEAQAVQAAKAAQPKPVDSEGRDNEPFWFLKDGGDDGWATTNPSEEWRKRHGDDKPEDYGN